MIYPDKKNIHRWFTGINRFKPSLSAFSVTFIYHLRHIGKQNHSPKTKNLERE